MVVVDLKRADEAMRRARRWMQCVNSRSRVPAAGWLQGRCWGRDSHGPCIWKLPTSRTVEDFAVLAAGLAS